MADVTATPARNDPCPCGSGRKFKQCHGALGGANATASAAPRALDKRDLDALVALLENGRLDEAERAARTRLSEHPQAGMLWKILAVTLVRQRKDALQALHRAAELLPRDAEAHGNLGSALCERGRWDEALTSLRRALELRPGDVAALVDSANALRALRRAGEALAPYQRALAINPGLVEARNNLGNAFLELRRFPEAIDCYRQALAQLPDNPQVLCNLGTALRESGRLDEALAASRRAVALDPRASAAHGTLGAALAAVGARTEAMQSLREAVRLAPGNVDALNSLGNVLREVGDRREAAALLRRAAELDPGRADTHCNLGNVLFELRRVQEAAASYRRALALRSDYAAAHLGLAFVQRQQRMPAEAAASCRAALQAQPDYPEALAFLGELKADLGQFVEAEQLFENALQLKPDFAPALASIATHRRMGAGDAGWLQRARALLARQPALGHEINLRYALGKYLDEVGSHDEAFAEYRQANELAKRYGSRYDGAQFAERVQEIIDSFAAAQAGTHAGPVQSQVPILIVGMPRSGTSLTEQILASHPQVFGAGEVTFWHAAYENCRAAQQRGQGLADSLAEAAGEYLGRLAGLSGGAARVVDKLPANFLYAGLIHTALPRARIIHMRRDPLDTCLSIYFQNFYNIGPYANDLDDLAHYYGQYVRITDHWRAVLPPSALLEVPYEGLIADQEGWTRRLLRFLDLPWDERCLSFEQTERAVITASRWQVRQKLHGGSVGRWRHYRKFLDPLQRLMDSEGRAAGG